MRRRRTVALEPREQGVAREIRFLELPPQLAHAWTRGPPFGHGAPRDARRRGGGRLLDHSGHDRRDRIGVRRIDEAVQAGRELGAAGDVRKRRGAERTGDEDAQPAWNQLGSDTGCRQQIVQQAGKGGGGCRMRVMGPPHVDGAVRLEEDRGGRRRRHLPAQPMAKLEDDCHRFGNRRLNAPSPKLGEIDDGRRTLHAATVCEQCATRPEKGTVPISRRRPV